MFKSDVVKNSPGNVKIFILKSNLNIDLSAFFEGIVLVDYMICELERH